MAVNVSPSNSALAALRVAVASAICFCISSLFHLELAYQSLVTVHIVCMNSPQGHFQRGLERLIGRVSGVMYGSLVVAYAAGWPGVTIAFMLLFQLCVWYMHAANRLAYAGIHMGVFSATTAATGLFVSTAAAYDVAIATATQIVLGVFVVEIVNALAADAGPIQFDRGTNPLFPLKWAWVAASLRITLASLVAFLVAGRFDLPVVPTMVSAMLITQAGDPAAAEWKAYLRMLGAVAAVLYCVPVLHLLAQAPSLGLLLGFIMAGIFAGNLLANRSTNYGYLGFQFGLAVGMILAGKPAELSDLHVGFDRVRGVVAGTAIAIVAVAAIPAPKL